MSTGIISESNEFIIPFSIPSHKRKSPFTLDLEVAAVFSFAELNREKGGGILLKQPEEIAFISKLGYPLLMYGWAERILVFDGFNKTSYRLTYASLPEVRSLIEEVRLSSKTRELYLNFLRNHRFLESNILQNQLVLNGLLQNLDVLNDINSCRHQANKLEDDSTGVTLLSPIIDESMILSEIRKIEDVHYTLQQDIEDLKEYMKLVDKITRDHVKELQERAKTLIEEFNIKIKTENERIAPVITELRQNNDNILTELIAKYDGQSLQIQKEIVKLEKNRNQAEEKIEQYKQQIKSETEKNKPAVEQRIREKINETQKEINNIDEKLKRTRNNLESKEELRALETLKLKDELDAKLKETLEDAKELEAAREANLLLYNQEKEQLETKTQELIDQIGRAIKLREADVAQFAKLGIGKESGSNEKFLLYLPFYIVCYEAGQKKRYRILSPSFASSVGFSTKLRGFLRRAKSKKILTPRFKAFYLLKETIYALIYQNPVFETQINEIGTKTNIFGTSSSKAEIRNALVCLKREGWFSDKEFSALIQRLSD